MKLLVCGGRNLQAAEWRDRLGAILDDLAPRCVIVGGCSGADELAERWAREHAVPLVIMPAHWKALGRPAGPLRNGWMLTFLQPDLVLALPGGDGTRNMVLQALDRGVEVQFG